MLLTCFALKEVAEKNLKYFKSRGYNKLRIEPIDDCGKEVFAIYCEGPFTHLANEYAAENPVKAHAKRRRA